MLASRISAPARAGKRFYQRDSSGFVRSQRRAVALGCTVVWLRGRRSARRQEARRPLARAIESTNLEGKMHPLFRVAVFAALVLFVAGIDARAQSVTFDFQDNTDQGFGAKFSNDASETFP